jgi:hypothetical protein
MYVSALSPPASGGRLPRATISPGREAKSVEFVCVGGCIPDFPVTRTRALPKP